VAAGDGAAAPIASRLPCRRVTAVMLVAAAALDLTRCGLVAATVRQVWEVAMPMSAGLAAELLVRGEASTGAADDLAAATALATQMVTEFGLSQAIGPVGYGGTPGQLFPGARASAGCSEQAQWLIDRDVAALLTKAEAH
jgi:ATP-dependent Zn protease